MRKMESSFGSDFTIADAFGESAIRDTCKRAFAEWEMDDVYVSELEVILNWKLWEHYEKGNMAYAKLYEELWLDVQKKNRKRAATDKEFARINFQITD